MNLKQIIDDANRLFQMYMPVINVTLIIVFIMFAGISYTAMKQEAKIADKCGFTDGKIRCVCSQDAWDEYIDNIQNPNKVPEVNLTGDNNG